MIIKNKRADIAITILVIAVVVLCATALFSFYAVGDRDNAKGAVNYFYYLQQTYNLGESVKYSIDNGIYSETSYEKECGCEINNEEITKEFLEGKLKIKYDVMQS